MDYLRYNALRAALVGYGVLGFGYLLSMHGIGGGPQVLGGFGTSSSAFLVGVMLQLAMACAKIAAKRALRNGDRAAPVLSLLDAVADGITVLLFALATFGSLLHALDAT